MRVRHKLLLILALYAVAGGTFVILGVVSLVRSTVVESATQRIHAETALIAEWTRTHENQDPHDLAVQAANQLGLRVTMIAPDGTVLGDSAMGRADLGGMENHLMRPEVQAALLHGSGDAVRRSATTNENYLYSARRVGGSGAVKIVRIALPVTTVHSSQSRYSWLAAGVVLAILLPVTVLAYGAVRRLSKPIERMSNVAERTAEGELALEVPEGGRDEVARLAAAVNRMKRALVEKIEELHDERSLMSSVISGMREGLLVVAPDRRIRLANDALRQILDLRFDPAGSLLAEVVRHPTVTRDVEHVLTTGREIRESVVRMPGSGRVFEVHVTPLATTSAQARTALVLFFDITRLEALEGVRRDFVANVSHELRTPLTSIKAFVETLIDGGITDSDKSLEFLRITEKHADRMGALIDDLTDLSLIETGAIKLELREVDAGQVAREVVEQLGGRADANHVTVHVELPSPFFVTADRRRLEQMLMNLVDNAIKFNRSGGKVWVRGHAGSDGSSLEVEDTGVGLPADSREKVFHRFYRVDPERSRRAGGTGLGLAIVKHLIRLHGGTVRVESELGRGSRFVLEFPERRAPAATSSSRSDPAA